MYFRVLVSAVLYKRIWQHIILVTFILMIVFFLIEWNSECCAASLQVKSIYNFTFETITFFNTIFCMRYKITIIPYKFVIVCLELSLFNSDLVLNTESRNRKMHTWVTLGLCTLRSNLSKIACCIKKICMWQKIRNLLEF